MLSMNELKSMPCMLLEDAHIVEQKKPLVEVIRVWASTATRARVD